MGAPYIGCVFGCYKYARPYKGRPNKASGNPPVFDPKARGLGVAPFESKVKGIHINHYTRCGVVAHNKDIK